MSRAPYVVAPSLRTGLDPRLAGLLLVAFGLRFGCAWVLPNIDHPDEIFQSLEPAHRLWTGFGLISWEWGAGIRSWVLPGLLAAVMRAVALVATDPDAPRLVVAAMLSALSLSAVAVAWIAGERFGGRSGAVFVAAVAAVWPELVYYAPKALSEAVAAHVLIAAAGVALTGEPAPSSRRLAIIGALLGLAVAMRVQLLPAAGIFAVWTCRRDAARWVRLGGGGVAVLAVFGLVDALTLGLPFQSLWKYVRINLIEGQAALYGVEPWWWYLARYATHDGVGFWLMAVGFLAGLRRLPFFAMIAAAVWLPHFAIGHKELRFLYPAVPFAIVVAAIGLAGMADVIAARLAPRPDDRRSSPLGRTDRTARPLARALAFLLVVATALTMQTLGSWRLAWTRTRADLLMDSTFVRADAACGVALWGVEWWLSGGYTHLDRPVPMYLYDQFDPELATRPPAAADWPAFDWVMAFDGRTPPAIYRRVACSEPICLWRRDGDCRETAEAGTARQDRVLARATR